MHVFSRVLAPVDGSSCSTAAVARAITLAVDQKADLHFVHVIDWRLAHEPFAETARAIHAAAEMLLGQAAAATE